MQIMSNKIFEQAFSDLVSTKPFRYLQSVSVPESMDICFIFKYENFKNLSNLINTTNSEIVSNKNNKILLDSYGAKIFTRREFLNNRYLNIKGTVLEYNESSNSLTLRIKASNRFIKELFNNYDPDNFLSRSTEIEIIFTYDSNNIKDLIFRFETYSDWKLK